MRKAPEGAGAERTQRVQRRDDGVRVLQDQAARRGKRQHGAQRSVQGLDLDLAATWEAVRALEREGEQGSEGKIVRIP